MSHVDALPEPSRDPAPSSAAGRPLPAAPPASFAELSRLVRACIDRDTPAAFARAEARAQVLGPQVDAAVVAVRELTLRGGKRVRAALVALGAWAASGTFDLEPIAPALVAYELFQSYLLVHDDWMDGDPVRRGGPSVPAALEAAYGGRELGAHTGVLAGDLACALAFEELARCPLPPSRVLEAMRLLARVHGDVVLGQLGDVLAPVMPAPPALERVHALKTASYTVEGPLVLGATLGGGGPRLLDGLAAMARPLGLAFQLRDDLLGTFGDAQATGKPTGGDVREGKRTALVAEVESDPEAMRLFRSAQGAADVGAVATFVAHLEGSGARARVEARLDERLDEARAALAVLDLPPGVRAVLEGAVTALGVRGA